MFAHLENWEFRAKLRRQKFLAAILIYPAVNMAEEQKSGKQANNIFGKKS